MPVEPAVSGHPQGNPHHRGSNAPADPTSPADPAATTGPASGPDPASGNHTAAPAVGATSTSGPAPGADPALEAERRHLAQARADLARMREHTLALKIQGGDPISAEYLAAALYRRAASLVDDPGTALFFGRTDHVDGARWYIGRRHVADAQGDPVVIDWRADVSRAFYRASRTEPMGVVRRRRFGIEHGSITAYEDEHLTDVTEHDRTSRILAREIERPRVGPMRDIVATIQPEQDEIVRADAGTSICVQGAPGTGKTAVGLHRAAWLLYAFRERLGRSGVLVVGPNSSFLEHVGAVLPSLGEADVRHTTVEALVGVVPAGKGPGRRAGAGATAGPGGAAGSRNAVTRTAAARDTATRSTVAATGGTTATVTVRVRGEDPVEVAALKGDARMAAVLHTAVWSHVRTPGEALVLPRGSRRWRVPAYQVAELVAELRSRGVRYAAARDMLPQRLAHTLLVQFEEAGDSPDDRVQDAVARSREVRRYAEAVWPALDPSRVLFRLFTDPDLLAACADGVLTPDEQRLLIWTAPPRTPGAARWTVADAVLLDELADLLRRTPSLGHVVLDEAQDLSAMQLRAVGRRCSTGSATVLGDIAQGTTPWATPSWAVTLQHLGQQDAIVEELSRGFRVPSSVIDYAARLLPLIAEGLTPPSSVREDPGSLAVTPSAPDQLLPELVAATRRALRNEGSVGLIVPDADIPGTAAALTADGIPHEVLGEGGLADGTGLDLLTEQVAEHESHPDARVWLVPARTAKGLEYDHVVVGEPAAIADAEPDHRTGLRRLYVVLTRAVTGLEVVHSRPLPGPLADPLD